MLKNKSFLYGLGTGLIIGAIMLQLMNAVTTSERKPPASPAETPQTELHSKP